MTDKNTLKLAEQFIEDVQAALQAEADYFSEGSKDVIAVCKERHNKDVKHFEEEGYYYSSSPYEKKTTKPVWNKNELFPFSKSFPDKCADLNSRKHPFQTKNSSKVPN